MSGRRNYGATKATSRNVRIGRQRSTSVPVELLTLVKISVTKGPSGD
jgi:hypothetical protein